MYYAISHESVYGRLLRIMSDMLQILWGTPLHHVTTALNCGSIFLSFLPRKERTVTRALYLIINKAPHSHFLQLIHLCFAIRTILYLRTEIRV